MITISSATAALERLEQQAGRVHDIVRVLAKYRLSAWLVAIPIPHLHRSAETRPHLSIDTMTREERVRMALIELGPTFIKAGQIMSTRTDLVGPDLARELSRLQSQTTPDSPEVVRSTIQQELGAAPEELFARFEPEAFASASIAQVHMAELFTGELVAVKVQKANIRHVLETDLSIMTSLAQLAEKHSDEFSAYEPVRLVGEFRQTIWSELDFTRELRNLKMFETNFADDDTVWFPRPYPELSSRRVLTMDFMDGLLGSDLETLRKEEGLDLDEFARRGAKVYLDMIFRDSFYHADPHPGNIMLMPSNVVGIIDCGMIGRLDQGLHDDFETLVLAVSEGDAKILAETLWGLSTAPPTLSQEQLEMEISQLLSESTEGSLADINLGETLTKLTVIIRKYKIRLRPGLSGLLKTLIELEGTAQLLNPAFSLAAVMRPYYEKIQMEKLSPKAVGKRLIKTYREWDKLLATLPQDVGQTLKQARDGNLQIKLDHRHLDAVVNRLVLGVIIAALLLGSCLMWSMKAEPLFHGVSIVGVVGFAIALFLGWTLFRQLEKPKTVNHQHLLD